MASGLDQAAPRGCLLKLYRSALAAVSGYRSVRAALGQRRQSAPLDMIAVGKAASAMALGARDTLGEALAAGLVITKRGHLDSRLSGDPRLWCLESDHPIPGQTSLQAGQALLDFLSSGRRGRPVLFLISGGASSLVEVLPAGVDHRDLARLNSGLLSSGLAIGQINAVRRAVSMIKGGRLAAYVEGRPTLCLLISDVPQDDPAVIGSGLLAPPRVEQPPPVPEAQAWMQRVPAPPPSGDPIYAAIEHQVIANLERAKRGAWAEARRQGLAAWLEPAFLEGDAGDAGLALGRSLLEGPAGVRIWGGETSVQLPAEPGLGGRSQHLALAAGLVLRDSRDCWLLAAGTDGTDGPGDHAGGFADGGTAVRARAAGLDPEACLRQADAGRCLAAAGDLLRTGPTGTNVMDLVLGLRG